MPPLRALHVLRDDHEIHVGGDLSELRGTVDGLNRHGVDAVAATIDDAPAEVDVVHLYNLWLPKALLSAATRARQRWPGARFAVTPIFGRFSAKQVVLARERAIGEMGFRRAVMERLTWRAVRRVLVEADLLLPNCQVEADVLSSFYRLGGATPFALLPNGTWSERWQAEPDPADRAALLAEQGLPPTASLVVACIARIEPRKNQLRLVEAVATIPDAHLLLVGPSSEGYGERVLARAEALLPGRFAWLGRRPQPEVARVLRAADVHALPSFLEVHCTADIEAALSGCEVVLSATPSTDELWRGLVHGCVPHDAASIAAAIERAMARPTQPAVAGRAMDFDFDVLGRQAAEAYQRFLA